VEETKPCKVEEISEKIVESTDLRQRKFEERFELLCPSNWISEEPIPYFVVDRQKDDPEVKESRFFLYLGTLGKLSNVHDCAYNTVKLSALFQQLIESCTNIVIVNRNLFIQDGILE
jgi:hypothetical protein